MEFPKGIHIDERQKQYWLKMVRPVKKPWITNDLPQEMDGRRKRKRKNTEKKMKMFKNQ